jgi:CxxC motif-containing protein (DUF1111 family)
MKMRTGTIPPLCLLAIAWGGCSQPPEDDGATGAGTGTEATQQAVTAPTGVKDPGARTGALGAGGPLAGLTAAELAAFTAGQDVFAEVDSVKGTIEGEEGEGLGPTFNAAGCAECHAHPTVGGTSPATNPQVTVATRDGATNSLPSFITAGGPVREVRLIAVSNAVNAALDGGVTGLFTVKGRTDAVGCTLAQPDFALQLSRNNVIFRIPTPVFGLGLVENTPDAALAANLNANKSAKTALGISGHLNTSGNDGTVTKFGWKAQNKSLLIFAGEAYNVEQGVSNEVFTNERAAVPGCVFNGTPEDGASTGDPAKPLSDVVGFANFMRYSAPPTPAVLSTSAQSGSVAFDSIGCVHCHSRNLTTAASSFGGMSNVTYHPFSDFAVHHLGSTLADGVNQGGAGPGDFRTAPLWGVGQRLFFMHDGRTKDLYQAIQAHTSPGNTCVTIQNYQQFNANGIWFQPFVQSQICASEANAVVTAYNALSATKQQDVLNFLRSL